MLILSTVTGGTTGDSPSIPEKTRHDLPNQMSNSQKKRFGAILDAILEEFGGNGDG